MEYDIMYEFLHLFFSIQQQKSLQNWTGQILSLCNCPFWTSFPRAKLILSKSVFGSMLTCPTLLRHSFLNLTSWLFIHSGYFCPLSPEAALSESQDPGEFLGASCMLELRAVLCAKQDKWSSSYFFPTVENLHLDDTIPSSPRFTHH